MHDSSTPTRLVLFVSLAGAVLGASCGESPQAHEDRHSPAAATSGVVSSATSNVDPTSHNWPIFRGNPTLNGHAPGRLSADLELRWSFETAGAIASSPIAVNERVYVGSDDGYLYCLNLADGSEIWKFQTEDVIEAPPLYFDGAIYVGGSDFYFYAIDAISGELLWKYETADTVLGGANVVAFEGEPARIVVGSYDATLYCFDSKTGDVLWTYETEDRVNGTPAVLDDEIVFGGCDSVLHVVNARDGTSISRVPLGADCHIAASVAVDAGHVYFGHYGCELVSIDLATHEVAWTYSGDQQPFFSSPAVDDKHVLIGGRDRRLHCVDRETGERLWAFVTTRKIDGSPIIVDGKVVFGTGDGRLQVLDLKSGESLWKYDLGRPIFSSPAVVDGLILIGCGDKRLYAFGEKHGL